MAAAGNGSNVYVSFDGLAELLRGPLTAQPALVPPAPALAAVAQPPPPGQKNDITQWPKMDLVTFCNQFDVPHQLQIKLDNLGVQGPHALCWMKDEDLRGKGGLMLGELGTLRDAEQRWKNFCSWDLD